jgi:RsbT co-antagonist protein rsbRD N-terminal domain
MARSGQRKSTPSSFAGFGDFVLNHREEILQSWIAAVDRNPKISTSDKLTYTQLLDHLPELCTELAALLEQPHAEDIKEEAKLDAKAHGWKRWRQGYKLDELIREICLVRRDFIDTWLGKFAAINPDFDIDAQSGARRVVEGFFDNVIIEATVQFVREHRQAMRQATAQRRAEKKKRAAAKAELVQLASHRLREPLGPLFFALEALLQQETLSPRGVEMIWLLKRNLKEEARAIADLLSLVESLLNGRRGKK